jgi:hypothetical protein
MEHLEEGVCVKFIYCNNYTKNFKFIYCDNKHYDYITTPEEDGNCINTTALYELLLKKLELTDNPTMSYQFHNYNNLELIYKTIALKHLDNPENYHNLINICDIAEKCPKTLAIIYTYININDINFSSLKVKLNDGNEISLNEYQKRVNNGGGLQIKTEQSFVRESTIQHYFENASNIPAPILEYEDGELIVVDGNNRLAYYLIKNQIPIIPAIIVIQNPETVVTRIGKRLLEHDEIDTISCRTRLKTARQ